MLEVISDSLILTLSLVIGFVSLLYYYGTRNYDFWKKQGVPYIDPKYPFVGGVIKSLFSQKNFHESQMDLYKRFEGKPFGGLFVFQKPVLFLRDPDLIETVLIKDFASFVNRSDTANVKDEPLQANLVNLADQQWKTLRAKLSPTFTSGKLKSMHSQLVDCADILVKYINQLVDKSEPIELREIMAKFTTDVIGSCAFGLNTNALNDSNSEFRKMGKELFKPTFLSKIRRFSRGRSRLLFRLASWFSGLPKASEFFVNVLNDTMSYREKNNFVRHDFVQILMELKKKDLEKQKNGQLEDDHLIIDDNVIASNAIVFFAAGFETTASTLSYCLYELSLHEDIQEKCYEHVVSVLSKHGGEVSYEAIKNMTYVHNVFAETLRIHSPAPGTSRMASKDYVIPGTNVTIPKGTIVQIPFYALQHDPQYFPEPDKFKPERFDSEKGNIRKGTYMPFGDGPRICIGKRFAEMEMQVALVKLLLNYKFKLNPKTTTPLVYHPNSLLLVPIGGIWVDVERRK